MDVNKHLIIIRGEDKTGEVEYFNPDKYLIKIKYKKVDKEYNYAKSDFKFYTNPNMIDIQNYKIVLSQGYVYNVKKLLKFDQYYKIFFDDETAKIVLENDLKLIKTEDIRAFSTNKFEYYKEISKIVSVKTEDGNSLLTNEYEKVNEISSDVALYKYLNPQSQIKKLDKKLESIIFPFGVNKSQFQAVRNAMTNQISIIEGPPGTGKTQTILNIIANIVNNGQTVVVVSNNNAATDNVYEKLDKYDLSYLCARLGRKENKETFISNQTGEYPEFEKKLENKISIQKEIAMLNNEVNEIFDIQNSIAQLKVELNEIRLQREYFNRDRKSVVLPKVRNIHRLTSEKITKLKIEYEEAQNINFWLKVKSVLVYGIGNKKFYENGKQYLIDCLDKLFFIAKEIDIENKIREKQIRLQQLGNDKLDTLIMDSRLLLNEYLRKKYIQKQERKIYDIKDLYNNSQEFVQDYPIVFSTTYSVRKCLNKDYKFDYIIMDEASQVDLITGVLALSVAENAVIVGDLKQLPNVITTENKNDIEKISKRYKINDEYNYLNHSFLSSISNILIDSPKTLLKEHYRCHPKIIQFCNKKFYNDELIILTEDKGEEDVLKVYITSNGNHARGHINQRQIDVIENEIMPELAKSVDKENIGIISPYRDQKRGLEQIFNSELKIDTIHKFQGREEEAIIITTVDNEIGKFVDDPKMLNVAVTRAKRLLRLVVSNSEQNDGTNIADLIKYIQYNNFEVIESKTKSIYDLLYKENRKQRLEYLKNKKRISDYDSENLTYNLIEEIIKENKYDNIDIAVHVPIRDILSSDELLTEEERKYTNNAWTHIDFVIYNKMDKKLVVALEVDGYYYHREGTKQQERDLIKDRILGKYDIPLLRLNTTGSGEREKIKAEMENIKF